MPPIRHIAYGILAVMAAGLLMAQAGALRGQAPAGLGVSNGRLMPPSFNRNSVSSQAHLYLGHPQRDYAAIEPLPLKNADASASLQALAIVLTEMPGIELVTVEQDYLHVQAQTRWLKFVDDLEFWINPARGVIELRSASRLGREDFGANRRRVEMIRSAYLAQD